MSEDSVTPDAPNTAGFAEFDDELSVLNHTVEYMNDADARAKERLLFFLVHRFFPEGSFSPNGSVWKPIKVPQE